MTAALIVLLAQDGKHQFSDPVSTYVPDVPNGKNITVAELLKMRSGIYNYTSAPEFSATLDADPTKVWTPQEVLTIAFRHPAAVPTRRLLRLLQHQLRNAGSDSREGPWAPVGRAIPGPIVRSARAEATSLPAAADNSIPASYSHGYMYGESAYAIVDEPYPADMQAAAKN